MSPRKQRSYVTSTGDILPNRKSKKVHNWVWNLWQLFGISAGNRDQERKRIEIPLGFVRIALNEKKQSRKSCLLVKRRERQLAMLQECKADSTWCFDIGPSLPRVPAPRQSLWSSLLLEYERSVNRRPWTVRGWLVGQVPCMILDKITAGHCRRSSSIVDIFDRYFAQFKKKCIFACQVHTTKARAARLQLNITIGLLLIIWHFGIKNVEGQLRFNRSSRPVHSPQYCFTM